MCHVIVFWVSQLQASLSPQNYSHHMRTSLDMLYNEVIKKSLTLKKYKNVTFSLSSKQFSHFLALSSLQSPLIKDSILISLFETVKVMFSCSLAVGSQGNGQHLGNPGNWRPSQDQRRWSWMHRVTKVCSAISSMLSQSYIIQDHWV